LIRPRFEMEQHIGILKQFIAPMIRCVPRI